MNINKMFRTTLVLIIALLVAMQTKIFAANVETIIVKEKESQYAIYIEDVINEDFSFAYSNTKEEKNLNYITAAKDTDGNYIAYVDAELLEAYFNDKNAYMWVKTKAGKVILESKEINLNSIKTIDELNAMNNLTSKIDVKSEAEDEKITIQGEEDKDYYYQFVKADSSEEYSNLANLIEIVKEYDSNEGTYVKLNNYDKLYELYNSLKENLKDEDWIYTSNFEITKPYTEKENEQYILWIKDSNGEVYIKLLTSYKKTIKTIEAKEIENKIERQIVLPNTYDDLMPLYIILGIALVITIGISIYKIKNSSRKD